MSLRRCPCGSPRLPLLVRPGSRSLLQHFRCRVCGLAGALMGRPPEWIDAWNAAVAAKLGEKPSRPADWIDVPVLLINESGFDWTIRLDERDPLIVVSKSSAQLERGMPGALLTLSIEAAYARRLGLVEC